MKHHATTMLVILLVAALLYGCSTGTEQKATPAAAQAAQVQEPAQSGIDDAAALVLDIPTTQYFTDETVATEDINTILMAGSNAPSAMNGQPWHFSAITDPAVIAEISGGMSFGGPPAGMGDMPEGGEAPAAMGQMPEGFEPPKDGETPSGMPEGGSMPEGGPKPEGGSMPEGAPSGDFPAAPMGGGTTKAGVEDAPLVIVVSCKAGSEFDAGLACQNMSVEAQLLGYGTKIVSAPTMAINAEGKEDLRATLGMPEGYTACALLLVGKTDTTVDVTADTYTGATARNPLDEVVTYLAP